MPIENPIADWNVAFAKYQATPEYAQVNHGMTLDAFKQARYDVLVNSSTPVAFTIDNDQTLWLWPQPAAAYGIKIDAISKPIDLVADTDVPGMPDEFHMLLVWGALLTIAITDAAPEVMQKAQMHHDMLRQRLVLDQGRVPCL